MAHRIPLPSTPAHLAQLKRIIKREEASNGKRLASWAPKRDLGLSVTKPKKVYTPNLNAIRNKDKNIHIPNKSDRAKNISRGTKRSAPSLASDRRKQGKFVETQGVFSSGMGRDGVLCPTNRTSSYTKTTVETKPRIIKDGSSHDKIYHLTNSDNSDESSDELDPIPFFSENKDALKIKIEPGVTSKEDENECPVVAPGCSYGSSAIPKVEIEPDRTSTISFLNSSKVYDEDNPAVSLIRLPDSFINTTDQFNVEEDSSICLRDLPEGQLGKIIIRKSGKMEIMLQQTKNTIKPSIMGDDQQYAMLLPGSQSIAMEPSLVTLGKVTEKFVLVPEWNNLLDQVRKENPFYW